VSEWKEIMKNSVAIDGHYNKVLTDTSSPPSLFIGKNESENQLIIIEN
jgi:hypothetical protein